MADELILTITWRRRVGAWLTHLLTATGAVLGVLALYVLHQGQIMPAFWLLAAAVLVDSVDGFFARLTRVTETTPNFDGALLDNMIDYLTYVIIPAFFLLITDILPAEWRFVGAAVMVLTSAYQFCQKDAKTDDHFFKGFPSYWNVVVLYMFIWRLPPILNLMLIVFLGIMVFVPVKYAHPSQPKYLSPRLWVRVTIVVASILWGVATAILMLIYPQTNPLLMTYSIAYTIFYVLFSLYRTLVPLK